MVIFHFIVVSVDQAHRGVQSHFEFAEQGGFQGFAKSGQP
jgi:hypothetical protein